MKTINCLLLAFITIVSINTGFAQEDEDEIKSIFNSGTELKGFGAIEFKLSPIADQNAFLVGGSGGVTVNKYLTFGIAGYGIGSKVTVENQINPGGNDLRLYGGYGGLLLGFNIFPRQVIHVSFPVVLGAGSVELEDPSFFSNSSDPEFTVERSSFFVAEPQVFMEINVTRFFRFDIGAGYRFVEGLSTESLSNEDMTNWTAVVALKFGSF